MKKLFFVLVSLILSASLFAAGAQDLKVEDIVDVATENGSFTTLLAALDAANLTETLKGDGPFTVFAPTDAAFAKLPAGTVDALLGDIPTLTDILLYHVVSGEVKAADVVGMTSATPISGIPFVVAVEGGGVSVAGSNVVATDVMASNGVIHVIDTVMLPPTESIVELAAGNSMFSTLVAAVQAADLADTLMNQGPFTVFAPTDDAFAKLPDGTVAALLNDIPTLTNILLYHVVAGVVTADNVGDITMAETLMGQSFSVRANSMGVYIDDAQVVATDIFATNGVIHVIDSVILPN